MKNGTNECFEPISLFNIRGCSPSLTRLVYMRSRKKEKKIIHFGDFSIVEFRNEAVEHQLVKISI